MLLQLLEEQIARSRGNTADHMVNKDGDDVNKLTGRSTSLPRLE
jgi:hypothetical protein